MGKLTTYILVLSGIMLIMYYAGILTTTNTLLTILLDPTNITLSTFFTGSIISSLELIGLGFIVIGSLLTKDPELAVFGTAAVAIMDLLFNFGSVYLHIISLNVNYTPIATLLFAPIFLLLGVTILEWFRGITS